jgi:hypothetical protein
MEASVYPSLTTLIGDIRAFVYNGLNVLPLTIIGTSLLLSLMTANYALLFMLFAMILIVPGILFGANLLIDLFNSKRTPGSAPPSRWFAASYSDACDLIPPFPIPSKPASAMSYTFGSYWLAMVSFFFGYTIANGVALLKKETQQPVTDDDATQKMVTQGANNRKAQAIAAIVASVVLFIIVFVMRHMNTTCEPYLLSIFSVIAFGGLGAGLYGFLAVRGEDRLSDIFGIANRLLSPDAYNNKPYACLPQVNK